MLLDLPLSPTVRPSRTPPTLSVTYLWTAPCIAVVCCIFYYSNVLLLRHPSERRCHWRQVYPSIQSSYIRNGPIQAYAKITHFLEIERNLQYASMTQEADAPALVYLELMLLRYIIFNKYLTKLTTVSQIYEKPKNIFMSNFLASSVSIVIQHWLLKNLEENLSEKIFSTIARKQGSLKQLSEITSDQKLRH